MGNDLSTVLIEGDLTINRTTGMSLSRGYFELKGNLTLTNPISFTVNASVHTHLSGETGQRITFPSGGKVRLENLSIPAMNPRHVIVNDGSVGSRYLDTNHIIGQLGYCGSNCFFRNCPTHSTNHRLDCRNCWKTCSGGKIFTTLSLIPDTMPGRTYWCVEHERIAEQDEEMLISKILKANNKDKTQNLKRLEKEIKESKRRMKEIDRFYQSAYEDKVKKIISVERFRSMTADYDEEQAVLTERLKPMEDMYDRLKQTEQDLTAWVDKIKNCLKIESLTRAVVVELIEKITLKETQNENGAKVFDIEIQYKFGVKRKKAE